MLIKIAMLELKNAVGKVLHQELIVIMKMVEHTMDVEEQYAIGMLLIIFVKILLLGVELGD